MRNIKKIISLGLVLLGVIGVWSGDKSAIKVNAAGVNVSYQTHVQDHGWMSFVSDGAMSGTSGEARRLEGIRIKLSGINDLGVQYQTHVQDHGWMDWVNDGAMSGTEGESRRLESIRIKLTGGQKDNYDIYYRVHVQDGGWLGWVKNGESSGTTGMSKRLEGIQIIVVSKGAEVPDSLKYSYNGSELALNYRTHIQDFGWVSYVRDGENGGTSGQSLRLEGIEFKVVNAPVSGGIEYKTHVQNYGWLDWVSDGAMSGTEGESLRLEAIQVRLTGELANHYDLYYRVHIQDYGWLDWAMNGAVAGSAGLSKRLEGVQAVCVPKGQEFSGVVGSSFVSTEGIDVSKWQGNIDWYKVAGAGKSFAMVRYFDRTTDAIDAYFFKNIAGARAAGMEVGTYVYATAGTVEEARAEANHLINTLKSRNISLQYPIAYDVESEIYQGHLTPSQVADLILAFKQVVESNGYDFVLYANLNWLNNKIDMSKLSDVKLWVARYVDIGEGHGYDSPNVVMWQHSSKGRVPGINGNVDLNVVY